MEISNIRLGFANNSSSTHSLIFLPDIKDYDVHDFGWNYFTAASRRVKTLYLASQLTDNIMGATRCSERIAQMVAKTMLGIEESIPYTDHQSIYNLPWNKKGNDINLEFFEDMKQYILQENLVILGGNDNEDGGHRLDNGKTFQLNIPRDRRGHIIAKRDRDWWVLFNKENGTKVRMSFKEKPNPKRYEKSETPELVDLKITNFCPYGCSYCYQDANKTGKHAEESTINNVLFTLDKFETFEVVLGGGEPTLHPEFHKIVRSASYHVPAVSFTTRNIDWFYKPENQELLRDHIKSCAFSVDKVDDIERFVEMLKRTRLNEHYNGQPSFSIQHIVDEKDPYGWALDSILRRCQENYLRVTLLGYKYTGRAKDGKISPKNVKWIETVMKLDKVYKLPTLSIDTTLAGRYEKELLEAEVPKCLFHTQEGKFSMYVDAVISKVGPSSYCEDKEMVDLPDSKDWKDYTENLGKIYNSF